MIACIGAVVIGMTLVVVEATSGEATRPEGICLVTVAGPR